MGGVVRTVAAMATAGMLVLAPAVAARVNALARTSGGLWELSGVPGASAPQRLCIADPVLLAQFEHRRTSCPHVVIRDEGDSAEIHYSCPVGGFGRTTITVLTPRSLRIETQGISGNAPFNYVLQARRISDC